MNKQLSVMAILVFVMAFCMSACDLQGNALSFRTADPRLTIGVRLQQPPVPPIAPVVLPTEEPSLLPTVTPTPCRTIAGNINSQGKKLWHDESSPQWSQIVIDESKGERWFCTPEEAEAAGWAKAGGN